MTKRTVLTKATRLGLKVNKKMTIAQIQHEIDNPHGWQIEDDVASAPNGEKHIQLMWGLRGVPDNEDPIDYIVSTQGVANMCDVKGWIFWHKDDKVYARPDN